MKKMNQKKKREEKVRMNKVKKMNGINKKKENIQMSIIVKNLTTLLLRANLLQSDHYLKVLIVQKINIKIINNLCN